ncbi:MAG: GTPase Era [Acidobacteriota bacterium]
MARQRKPKHVSGFVTILGRPNAGKSTLLNRLAGSKLAIVADKPQTTRDAIQAVLTLPQAQIIFVDTPGVHEPRNLLNEKMMDTVRASTREQDLLIWLADASIPFNASGGEHLKLLEGQTIPALVVLNKIDLLRNKADLIPLLDAYGKAHPFEAFVPVSAATGEGFEDLLAEILKRMPKGPQYYPADYLTDQPMRFLAAELVREQVLLATGQEVPHSVAVLIEKWDESAGRAHIAAAIHVEREGQKPIVIGKGGAMLKTIGTAARQQIEERLGKKVFLELFVKVKREWRSSADFLHQLESQKISSGIE